jgi:hypothetical protein
MSKYTYAASSPYATTSQTNWYIGYYAPRAIPPAADDKPFTVLPKHDTKPTVLSNDLYGTPALWWVFAVRNRNLIKDPVWDLKEGLEIIVPSLATLKKALGI